MEGFLAFIVVIWLACAGVVGFALGHEGFHQAETDARFAGKCVDAMHGKVTQANTQNLCVIDGKIVFTAKR